MKTSEILDKVKTYSTSKLKEIIKLLFDDYRDGADDVMMCALNELEKRIDKSEFIEFCDNL